MLHDRAMYFRAFLAFISHMLNYQKAKEANKGKKKYSRQEGGSPDRFNQLSETVKYAKANVGNCLFGCLMQLVE
jgi:hypothetical protein